MNISKEREYVLLSVKWSRKEGYLLFWGHQTDDNEERSYGGYTMDLDTCEKYAKEEVNGYYSYQGEKFHELVRKDDDGTWAIKISDLESFGQKKTIIWR